MVEIIVARIVVDACKTYLENPQKVGRDIRDVKNKISDIYNDTPARDIYWREASNYVSDKIDDFKTGFISPSKVSTTF